MNYEEYRDQLLERIQTRDLPFAGEEYARRLARVRAAMQQHGFDFLVATEASHLCYLTGYNTFEVSVQCALLISSTRTVLIVPAIEVGPAVYTSRVDQVIGYPWESLDSAADKLVESLAESGASGARVGLDLWSGSLRPGLLAHVKKTLPQAQFEDMGALIDRISLVKSEPELDYSKQCAAITGAGLDAAMEVAREGVTDHEIARAGVNALVAGGSEFMSMQPIVATGFRSGIIHTNHAGFTVNEGDVVFIEFGAALRRYTAPMMRTAVIGEATPEMREFHGVVLDVLDAVMKQARTGATFDEAARAGERALAPIVDRAFFSGVFGYPVGIQFPPSWVAGSTLIARGSNMEFEDNVVFHLPICLRKPGEWGIGFSETVRVTGQGAMPITRNDRALHIHD